MTAQPIAPVIPSPGRLAPRAPGRLRSARCRWPDRPPPCPFRRACAGWEEHDEQAVWEEIDD